MSRIAADLVCRSLLCFGIAAAVGGFLRDGLRTESDAALDLDSEETAGVFGTYQDGVLVPTDVIPLTPGVEFGWRVAVDEGVHTWREVLITPAAPREWVGADLTIIDGGKVGITERTEAAPTGLLEHAWTITEGDPAGPHEIQLYVDGLLVKNFRFIVR